jgi:hypothetical protein
VHPRATDRKTEQLRRFIDIGCRNVLVGWPGDGSEEVEKASALSGHRTSTLGENAQLRLLAATDHARKGTTGGSSQSASHQ